MKESRARLAQFLSQKNLSHGVAQRFDCPLCGGYKTLSIMYSANKLIARCWRLSCNVMHIEPIKVLAKDVREMLEGSLSAKTKPITKLSADTLRAFRHVEASNDAVAYLNKFDISMPYSTYRQELAYDTIRHRLVFMLGRDEFVVNAIGRTLITGGQPKWYVYNKESLCNGIRFVRVHAAGGTWTYNRRIVCVVEDAISALVVCNVIDGYATLGTSLQEHHICDIINNYDEVVIWLDPDAELASIKYARSLAAVGLKTYIIRSSKDPKYYNKSMVNEIISYGIKNSQIPNAPRFLRNEQGEIA